MRFSERLRLIESELNSFKLAQKISSENVYCMIDRIKHLTETLDLLVKYNIVALPGSAEDFPMKNAVKALEEG